jgi:rubrerythrin
MTLSIAMSNWTPEEISWDRFDPSLAGADIVKLVKAASMVEYNARDYATYLRRVFASDPALQKLALEWAESEVQHGQTLGRWAKLADPDFDHEMSFKRFKDGFHVPIDVERSVRGSLSGELLARCVVETGTSSHYTAIREATREPVLRELLARIAADEWRHYRAFYELSKGYLEKDRLGLAGRLRVVAGRVAETQDDELAYAYYAANGSAGPFDRKRYSHAYARRAYPLYQLYLVERICAMLFKIVGLRPHGRLSRFVAGIGYRFLQGRAKRFTRENA